MLFSSAPRCGYARPAVHEVICQLRFPTILSSENREPADFQDMIRGSFPRYAQLKENLPPKVIQASGAPPRVENLPPVTNYSFVSADTLWKLNLTKDFVALSTLHYTRWEEFASMLDKTLAAFIRVYQPAFFERIGLRYVNIIARSALSLDSCEWRELIAPAYLGPMAEEDVNDDMFSKYAMDAELPLDSSSHVKIHAGPVTLKPNAPGAEAEKEQKFVLDLDLSMSGNISPHFAAGGLETLHAHSTRVFRGAITDALHEAMGPQ